MFGNMQTLYKHVFTIFRNCLAFVMIPILQKEIDIFVELWNSHRIRKQKDVVLPDGIPNHIFDFPEQYNLEESGK